MELYAFKRNNFILNKLLPCLIITMFAIMCLYGSSVYATDNNTISAHSRKLNEDVTYILPDLEGDLYYFIYDNKGTGLLSDGSNLPYYESYLFYSSSPINFETKDNSYFTFLCDSSITRIHSQINYPDKLDTYTFDFSTVDSSDTYNYKSYSNGDSYNSSWITNCISYNNYDIYKDNELLFQAPSQTQATIVASQVGEVEMSKTLQEILGILPVVIVVLVGLIAIRKGIQFLIARMKKA